MEGVTNLLTCYGICEILLYHHLLYSMTKLYTILSGTVDLMLSYYHGILRIYETIN